MNLKYPLVNRLHETGSLLAGTGTLRLMAAARTILLLGVICCLGSATAFAQRTGQPIWTPLTAEAGNATEGVCFRKAFTLVQPEEAQVRVEATGSYELYLNSRLIHRGSAGEVFEEADLRSFVQPGLNLIAIRVEDQSAGNGMQCYFRVRENGEIRWRSIGSDATWLTSDQPHPLWNSASLPDRGWVAAEVVNPAEQAAMAAQAKPLAKQESSGKPAGVPALPASSSTAESRPAAGLPPSRTGAESASIEASKGASSGVSGLLAPRTPRPKDSKASPAPTTNPLTPMAADKSPVNADTKPRGPAARDNKSASARPQPGPDGDEDAAKPEFQVPTGFVVEALAANDECGSVIAMAIDELGRVVLSRESGGLVAIDLSKPHGSPGRMQEICKTIQACQGIQPLNGNLYVTGSGPEGLALYELKPVRNDLKEYRISRALLHFTGEPGEHGPHGVTLGTDGRLYVIVGNGSSMKPAAGPLSPYRNPIDMDIVPRMEDPGGHAVGVRAPGGTVVRVALDGSNPEIVAGGIRNAYDLVFNPAGDLFVHDSDMESDQGMAWLRSTQLFHVPLGGDLGWRSGWCNLPNHCLDTTPPIADTGRGSPTGIACYQHVCFPARYHNALFLADWSEGRILVARPEVSEGGYTTEIETFLTGRPMNVTDLAVAEDGSLLFCTGGRGTWGGVFRVRWDGKTPAELLEYESDLARILRMPQPDSAWARQNLALLNVSMGDQWAAGVIGAANETRNPVPIRMRAMDLMYLYGVKPSSALLNKLLSDPDPSIRARATRLCGVLKTETGRLATMLEDVHPSVRRAACEAWMELEQTPPQSALLKALGDPDRHVSLTAQRLLMRQPVKTWLPAALASTNLRSMLAGSIAAMAAAPDLETSYQVLAECAVRMKGFVNDRDFTDMLRVIQVALTSGKVDPKQIPAFVEQIKAEFPTTNSLLNSELARVLIALRITEPAKLWVDYLKSSSDPEPIKVQTALYLSVISDQLGDDLRIGVIDYLHEIQRTVTGGNRKLYLAQGIQKTARALSESGIDRVLTQGAVWNQALIPVFYRIEGKVNDRRVAQLIHLDGHLRKNASDPTNRQVRLGILALLASSGSDKAMEHLRQLWRDEPERRLDLALGLAQKPKGENWSYLVASIPLLDNSTASDVLEGLLKVPQKPVDSRHFRDLIELGYRLGETRGTLAARLVEHWADQPVCDETAGWKTALTECSEWFQTSWPDEQPIAMPEQPVATPTAGKDGRSVPEIVAWLEKNATDGNPERGHKLFQTARCAACHRFGTEGETNGPDLTSLASRFSRRETVEAILNPDATVPEQYRATSILTDDGTTYLGLVINNGDGTITLTAGDGEKIRIPADSIEEQKLTTKSSMPANLIDSLSLEEINDLVAYLHGTRSAGSSAARPASTRPANTAQR